MKKPIDNKIYDIAAEYIKILTVLFFKKRNNVYIASGIKRVVILMIIREREVLKRVDMP